jgi:hypothetical protein
MERFGGDADGLVADLERAGISTTGFGEFGSVPGVEPSAFDYERAMPILVKWLPRAKTPALREVIARGMTGEPSAGGEGARALVAQFRVEPDELVRWAIANALSTLSSSEHADDLIDLLQDSRHGSGRQNLCEALRRTKDPRAPDVLIGLIRDPAVGGHAIHALRAYGPKSSLPHLRRCRPALEDVVADPKASGFARRMAKKSLERIDASTEGG